MEELNDKDAEENKIENFTDKIEKNWGKRECKLRTAIYVSFL